MSVSLINRDPFVREIRDVMQDFFRTPLLGDDSTISGSTRLNLRSDLVERDDSYLLAVELPGVRKEDIDVSIAGDTITISANKCECFEESSGAKKGTQAGGSSAENWYHWRERQIGRFQRSFKLPSNADVNKAVAKNEYGTLILQFPKITGSSAHRKLMIA